MMGEHLIKTENEDLVNYSYLYKTYNIETDTIQIPLMLTYWKKSKMNFGKRISYLDSIKLYDKDWFTEESRVMDFWGFKQNLRADSLKIYVIEKTKNGDSIIFRKVNRSFIGWR